MMSLGPLGFAAPLALAGLLALPILWLILRATPPAPREVVFAPLRLLQRIARTPETPDGAPWWLVVFRLLIAALVVLALAQPVWRPDTGAQTGEPLMIVIDDGWAAADAWPRLKAEARARIETAGTDGRRVALLMTASPEDGADGAAFGPASAALDRLAEAEPRPWAPDRTEAAERMERALAREGAPDGFETIWLSDGVAGEDDEDRALARALSARGRLVIAGPPSDEAPLALAGVNASADGFTAEIRRPARERSPGGEAAVTAIAGDGQALTRTTVRIEPGASATPVEASLPLDLRNRIRSIRIEGENSAGAVQLLDDAWRRPRIGLIETGAGDRQPLLSDLHYTRQALAPHAELISGSLDDLLEQEPSGLVMVDGARQEDGAVEDFVTRGGVLIRFAGPRLAARGDGLLPVRLRQGGRLFGGAMAWEDPQTIGEFSNDSPFAGLQPNAEARIERQVLAEPTPDLDDATWARLEDGTPLVTARRRGEGWIVLFHVTAGPDWSSLPLSGLFPDMLRRVAALAEGGGAPADTGGSWQLDQAMDGYGRLRSDGTPQAEPIPADAFADAAASPETPPGIWRLGAASAALNAVSPGTGIAPLTRDLPGAIYQTREGVRELRLTGPMLAIAALLFALDVLIALALSGRMPALRRTAALLALGALLPLAARPEAVAQDEEAGLSAEDEAAMAQALEVRFGYVRTGDSRADRVSEAGLSGLSRELAFRTAIEPGEPAGVDIEDDEILFFPLIYWPVTETTAELSEQAAAKVNAYLNAGGMIVFDTRDGGEFEDSSPALEALVERIDIPPLRRTPDDHVLTRAFYLLEDFPGRYPGGEVWVEASEDGTARDGVSSVVIGSADWAGAWAREDGGMPLAPVEGGDRAREMSLRFGINLAMYALTGNYKSDQVHVPAILERLGEDGPARSFDPESGDFEEPPLP